jgi:hypothetical protein
MDGWTIGTDVATMLTSLSVLTATIVWTRNQWDQRQQRRAETRLRNWHGYIEVGGIDTWFVRLADCPKTPTAQVVLEVIDRQGNSDEAVAHSVRVCVKRDGKRVAGRPGGGRHSGPGQRHHGDRHVGAGGADRAPPRRQAAVDVHRGRAGAGRGIHGHGHPRGQGRDRAGRLPAGDVLGERVHPKTGRHMVYVAARPAGKLDVVVGDPDELSEVRWMSQAEAGELLPGMFEPVKEYLAATIT